MTLETIVQQSDMSRVWVIPFTAGPNRAPSYEGLAMADTPEVDFGTPTPIFIPDPGRYRQFTLAGKVLGDRQLPTMSVNWYYRLDAQSVLDRFIKSRCSHDLHIHMGECSNPNSFDEGWDKILLLEGALPTGWTTSASIGALAPDGRSLLTEDVPFTADRMYHIYKMQYSEQAAAQIVQEIIAVDICDAVQCGSCGIPSNGYDKVFALTLSNAGSPGLSAEVIFTSDGGDNWLDTLITTLAANEDPDDMECVGVNLVVISEDSESIHYAPLADILEEQEVWTEVTTGFSAGNGPRAMFAGSSCHVWMVGAGGFVYFSTDPTVGVTETQDAGVATVQDLNAIHGYDIQNLVAVGNANAVILTRNGGATWSALTGPNPATVLNTVWMKTQDEWWIGDAAGQLWFTVDGGVNWTEKLFPGSGAGEVRDIKFASNNVAYLAHDTVVPAGRILRSINGGFSWFVEPLLNGITVPANDRITALAVSLDEVNVLYAGGLADNATDGIMIKGLGPTN